MNIFTQDNFLSFANCDMLIDYYEYIINDKYYEDMSYGKTIQIEQIDDSLTHYIMSDIRIRTSNFIKSTLLMFFSSRRLSKVLDFNILISVLESE